MKPSEKFKAPVIGTIETKPLKLISIQTDGSKKEIIYPPETYEVIDENDTFYVCNEWYKEYNYTPQLVPESEVKFFKKKDDDLELVREMLNQ